MTATPPPAHLETIAEMFRLLGDPTRLRILLTCLEEPMPVARIAQTCAISQSLASHHLRLLRGARLVRGTRKARQIFYQAADEHVRHMLLDVTEHAAEEARPLGGES